MDKRLSPLIAAGEVKSALATPGALLVDARGGTDARERWKAGHIEGAVMVDLETDLSDKSRPPVDGGRHPLPHPRAFADLLGSKGISPTTHVLIYDDKAGANAAARFWWMLRAAGHEKVQVVDGGLTALQEAGLQTVTGSEVAPPPAIYPVTDWQLPIADIEDVDRARSDPGSLVIDVREGYRYRGESEPIDLVAGHIPGAVNIPYLSNLEANGHFRPPATLANFYRARIGNRQNIIVHCGSGVTACHTLLAMDAAGLPAPRLYVGSWSEWSRNAKPVAKSDHP